jgi:hypothetical protein
MSEIKLSIETQKQEIANTLHNSEHIFEIIDDMFWGYHEYSNYLYSTYIGNTEYISDITNRLERLTLCLLVAEAEEI